MKLKGQVQKNQAEIFLQVQLLKDQLKKIAEAKMKDLNAHGY